jgi:hypothetical protein
MSTTFLQAVNDVLVRLREVQVSSLSETTYATLIGKFVNDAKRQVEDAYSWNVLTTTITVPTVSATSSYTVTGAGQKFQVRDAINATSFVTLTNVTFAMMNRYLNFPAAPATGIPMYYSFNGVDSSTYDTKVSVFPIPDGVYSLKFSLVVPQATLTSASDVISVPAELVIQNAYARALVERGEDGGLTSSEAYQLYRGMLADSIALEGTRFPEEGQFVAV